LCLEHGRAGELSGLMLFALLNVLNISIIGVTSHPSAMRNARDTRQSNVARVRCNRVCAAILKSRCQLRLNELIS
jgi:hypothetical protein